MTIPTEPIGLAPLYEETIQDALEARVLGMAVASTEPGAG